MSIRDLTYAIYALARTAWMLRSKRVAALRDELKVSRAKAFKGCRATDDEVVAVSRSVGVACALFVSRSLCLRRALVTAIMLHRAGIEADVVLGVKPLGNCGHAWVEVGAEVVDDVYFDRSEFVVVDRL